MDHQSAGQQVRRRAAGFAVLATLVVILTAVGLALWLVRSGSDSSHHRAAATSTAAVPTARGSATARAGAGSCGLASGSTSDAVSVVGTFGGKDLTVRFPRPVVATELQRTLLARGGGARTVDGQWVVVVYSVYDGRTGKRVSVTRGPAKVGDKAVSPDLNAAAACVPLGSRVVTTFPASDLYGPSGNAQQGVGPHDALVVVTDVVGLKHPPVPVAWPDAPAVRFGADGVPKVRLIGPPPPDLRLHVIEGGSGPVVRPGDSVRVTYVGISWSTHEVFDDSQAISPTTIATQEVIPGFGAGLVGQRIGSRVIITVPAKYAIERYRDGDTKDLRGRSVVFVISILSAATP